MRSLGSIQTFDMMLDIVCIALLSCLRGRTLLEGRKRPEEDILPMAAIGQDAPGLMVNGLVWRNSPLNRPL